MDYENENGTRYEGTFSLKLTHNSYNRWLNKLLTLFSKKKQPAMSMIEVLLHDQVVVTRAPVIDLAGLLLPMATLM